MKTYTRAQRDKLAEWRHSDDGLQAYVTANGVVWEELPGNINGSIFYLIREPHHTDAQIEEAKRLIRADHDVVGLHVAYLVSEQYGRNVAELEALREPSSRNSMVCNPKLVALLERTCEIRVDKLARGMSEGTNGYLAFASSLLAAADEYGVDLRELEAVITFNEEAPIVMEVK